MPSPHHSTPSLLTPRRAAAAGRFLLPAAFLIAAAAIADQVIIEGGGLALEGGLGIPAGAGMEKVRREDGDAAGRPAPRGITPPEYAGPAMPVEDSSAIGLLDRAREHFAAREWAKGLDILDGMLARKKAPAAEPGAPPAQPGRPAGALAAGLRIVQAIGRAVKVAMPAPGGEPGSGEAEKKEAAAPAQTVFSADGIHYESFDGAVRRVLLDLPREGREVYRAAHEPPARKMLDEALALPFEASLDRLAEVARRYPLVPAGLEALETLGDRALDLGHAARAAAAYERLIENRAPRPEAGSAPERDPQMLPLLVRAAVAELLAGRAAGAGRLLDRIARDFPEDFARVGGEPVRGALLREHPLIRRLLEPLESVERPIAWTCPMGRPDHAVLDLPEGAEPPAGSRARWIFHFPGVRQRKEAERPAGVELLLKRPLRESSPAAAYPALQVASDGGLVFTRSGGDLVAIDAATGKLRWRAAPATDIAAAGASSGSASEWHHFQNLGSASLCLAGGLVIAIDRQSEAQYDQQGKLLYAPNRLFAYDARSGKLKWRLGGPEEPQSKLRALSFTAPPTEAGRDLLVAPATDGDGPFAVGLTLSGRLRWVERLYGYNAGYLQRNRSAVSQGASLAVADGIAVSAPGHGVVTALDAESGRIRWMTRYRTTTFAEQHAARSSLDWAPSQPVISAGRVIAAPYDSTHLVALDLESGKTLWERAFTSGIQQLLGADGELTFVAGERVEAVEIATGSIRYQSDPFRWAAGRGFLTARRIYLPLEDGIAVLESKTGKLIERMGFTDDRMDGLKPGNLAIAALPAPAAAAASGAKQAGGEISFRAENGVEAAPPLRLVATGAWGVAMVYPQEEAWVEIERRAGRDPFQRANLLRGEGSHGAALDLLESILAASRTDGARERARAAILETAREAASRSRDAGHLERVLRNEALDLSPELKTSLQLEMARFLEETAPPEAAAIYLRIIAAPAATGAEEWVPAPDGISASPARYAADSLRELVAGGKIGPPEEGREPLRRLLERFASEAEPSGALIEEVQRQVHEKPYLPEAAEGLALLARLAAIRRDAPAAAAHLQRLAGDYSDLSKHPEISARRLAYDGCGRSGEPVPEAVAAAAEDPALKWTQRFWKGLDQGILVDSFPGSRPLGAVLAMRAGKLKAIDLQGNQTGEVELPGFPDVEEPKAGLQSHIEEPASLLARGGDAILFTAAGIYQLRFPAPEAPEAAGAKPPPPPEVGWYWNTQHAIEELHRNKPQWGWGWNVLARVPGNLFPEFLLPPGGESALVLLPDGSLQGIELAGGKMLLRLEEAATSPLGEPALLGARLAFATATPAGMAVHPLDRRSAAGSRSRRGAARRLAASKGATIHRAALVPETAAVLDTTRGIEVIDERTQRVLWREQAPRAYPTLVRATGSEVWIANPNGFLEARSLRGGRLRWSAPIPRSAMPIRTYDDGAAASEKGLPEGTEGAGERAVWIALATNGSSPATRSSHAPFLRYGEELVFVQVTESGRKLREATIAGRGVTFDGRRRIAGGRWLIAYNEGGDQGRWFARAALFDPETGAHSVLFEAGIAGKGTGQPPRLAFIGDVRPEGGAASPPGLAFGTAEGFGLFTPAPPAPEGGDAATKFHPWERESPVPVPRKPIRKSNPTASHGDHPPGEKPK